MAADRCWIRALLLAVIVTCSYAQNPCDSLTGQDQLEVNIVLEVFEATDQELTESPDSEQYWKPLEMVGELEGVEGTREEQAVRISLLDVGAEPLGFIPRDNFRVEMRNNGLAIKLSRALNRDGQSPEPSDDIDVVRFRLMCTVVATSDVRNYPVTINILDKNDNAPVFSRETYDDARVPEGLPSGTLVYSLVEATDLDKAANKEIDFTIVPDPENTLDGSDFFEIPSPRLGKIRVRRMINFEEIPAQNNHQFVLNIQARDNGETAQSSTAKVVITIEDVDNQGPTFLIPECQLTDTGLCLNPVYTSDVINGQQSGELVMRPTNIRAEDRDTLRSTIRYSIVGTIPSGFMEHFFIDPTAGAIRQVTAVTTTEENPVDTVILRVMAEEQTHNKFSYLASVVVTVSPDNVEGPQLVTSSGESEGYIGELAVTGTPVVDSQGRQLRIIATDPDEVPGGTTTLFSYTVETLLFSVDSVGLVYFSGSSDDLRAAASPVYLQVQVAEVNTERQLSTRIDLTIHIRDANDHAPVFTQELYEREVEEGRVPTDVVDLDATDDDEGVNGEIRYTIASVSSPEYNESFALDATSGRLSMTRDIKAGTTVFLSVRAEDQSEGITRYGYATVAVKVVTFVNLPPAMFNSYIVNVSEANAPGFRFFQIPAIDPEGGPLTFTLQDGNFDQSFELNQTNGVLTLLKALDRETTRDYFLGIDVRDDSGNSARTTVQVAVEDVNDNNPVIARQPIVYFTKENDPVGTNVGQKIQCSDADNENEELNFFIAAEDLSSYFNITTDGQLFIKTLLDREEHAEVFTTVYCADEGGRMASARIKIYVDDAADYIPYFPQTDYTAMVPSDKAAELVTRVEAIDLDLSPAIEYIIATDDLRDKFTVDSRNGFIRTARELDWQERRSYKLEITTTDGRDVRDRSYTATVTINVLPFNGTGAGSVGDNLHDPEFSQLPQNVTVLETKAVGERVYKLDAYDADDEGTPQGSFLFSLDRFYPDNMYSTFLLNPYDGQIRLARPLTDEDRKDVNLFTVEFTVRDKGYPERSSKTNLTIVVQRNQHSPIFGEYQRELTIQQDQQLYGTIATFTATDEDKVEAFNRIKYSIVGDGAGPRYFSINDKGELQLQRSLSESSGYVLTYQLRIRATDILGEFDEATVTVTVVRNLQTPQFESGNPTEFTLPETQEVGLTFGQLRAFDYDELIPHNSLVFTMSGDEEALKYFSVTPTVGERVSCDLKVKKILVTDENRANEYRITVGVRDEGLPEPKVAPETWQVVVRVTRNTARPRFTQDVYNITIKENMEPEGFVLRVEATDDDEGDYGRLKYSVTGDGLAVGRFIIRDNTYGDINLNHTLAEDPVMMYTLRVTATDGGTPPLYSTTIVYIHVERNLHDPAFELTPYEVTINETIPVGTMIYNVSASDQDTVAPNFDYYFFPAQPDSEAAQLFGLRQETGEVFIRASMLNSNTEYFTFEIVVRDRGMPAREGGRTSLQVTCVRNGYGPRFQQTPYTATITERRDPGYSLKTILATDDDRETYNVVTYSIVGDDEATRVFEVDPQTGEITLREEINPESLYDKLEKMYQIVLMARDDGVPSRIDTTVMTVIVRQVGLNPEITNSDLSATISESFQTYGEVLRIDVRAEQLVGELRYRLLGDYPGVSFFEVNNQGSISTRRSLREDRLDTTEYRLRVEVYDSFNDQLKVEAPVTITVERNPGTPVFERTYYDAEIWENMPVKQDIVEVRASDPDDDEVRFKLESGTNSALSYFQMDERTGQLQLQYRITGMEFDNYVINVSATDVRPRDTKQSFAEITVTVKKVLAPAFDDGSVRNHTINELFGVGETLTSLRASDGSPYGQIVYYLDGYGIAMGFFALDPDTGDIRLTTTLEDDPRDTFTLRPCVYNRITPSLRNCKEFVVTVERPDNQPPRWDSLPQEEEVREDMRVGDVLTTIYATDSDMEGNLVYDLIGEYPGTEFFGLRNEQELYLKKDLYDDLNRTPYYTLRVTVHDSAWPGQRTEGSISVRVERNLNAPTMTQDQYDITIRNTLAERSPIIVFVGRDEDRNDVLSYDFSGQPEASTYFEINAQSGLMTLRSSLERFTGKEITFDVEVKDSGTNPKTGTAPVKVTIENVYDVTFSQDFYAFTVTDRMEVGRVLETVQARYVNIDGVFNYRYSGIDPAGEYFSVEQTTGEIKLVRTVESLYDRSQFTLIVEAYDVEKSEKTGLVTCVITVERSPETPTFESSSYATDIDEHLDVGSDIGVTVRVAQPSPDGVIYYANGEGDAPTYFAVRQSSGRIVVSTDLVDDPAKGTEYNLVVVAKDRGPDGLEGTATVTIRVARNQYDPVFQNTDGYTMEVPEDYKLLTTILHVEARDDDPFESPNGQVTYSLSGSEEAAAYFGLEQDTGRIYLIKSLLGLDGTAVPSQFTLEVKASDGGTPARSQTAYVYITKTGDPGAPRWEQLQYDASIDVTAALNYSIVSVTAYDDNLEGEIRYELVGEGKSTDLFAVNPATGELYVNADLRQDTGALYIARIQAYDSAREEERSSCTVRVFVNRNPNTPQYSQGTYDTSILETQELGETIITLVATDEDEGKSGEILYRTVVTSYVPDYAEGYFYVNPKTGEVSVIRPLLRDLQKATMYTFDVVATDQGSPPKETVTRVEIRVQRNPAAPRFIDHDNSNYSIEVAENQAVGGQVYVFQCEDADGDRIKYTVTGVNPAPVYLAVDEDTGAVTLQASLLDDTAMEHKLTVKATDSGVPEREETVMLAVTVVRNRNAPVFEGSKDRQLSISEYAHINKMILHLRATDQDNGRSGQLFYELVDVTPDASKFFMVNPTTGEVTVAKGLYTDWVTPRRDRFEFQVKVSDNGIPRKSDVATVTVNVMQNAGCPEFAPGQVFTRNVTDTLLFGDTLFQFEAEDSDAKTQAATPNAQVYYYIPDDETVANKYFQVNPERGTMFLKQSLRSDPLNTPTYQFKVRASDRGDPPCFASADVTLHVERGQLLPGEVGFRAEDHLVELSENFLTNTEVLSLDVINLKEEEEVECYLEQEGNIDDKFTVIVTEDRNCQLQLTTQLDYELVQKYTLKVRVNKAQVARRKRQVFEAYPMATVIVLVKDVNDNRPEFVYRDPPYWKNEASKTYFGLVDEEAGAFTFVMNILAEDIDGGDNGNVTYSMGSAVSMKPANAPFAIHPKLGDLRTARDLIIDDLTLLEEDPWRMDVKARDNPRSGEQANEASSSVLIHLVSDINRFVMVLKHDKIPDVVVKRAEITRLLQEHTKHIVVLEKITGRHVDPEEAVQNNTIESGIDATGTDLTFILIEPQEPFHMMKRPDVEDLGLMETGGAKLDGLRKRFEGVVQVELIRQPFQEVCRPGQTSAITGMLTNSHDGVSMLGDWWWALITIAALMLLAALVAIIVLCCAFYKYKRQTLHRSKRTMMYTEKADVLFGEPPQFLKEFETQSLEMYVPTDDKGLGDVEVKMQGDVRTMNTGASADGGFSNPAFAVDSSRPTIVTTEYASDTVPTEPVQRTMHVDQVYDDDYHRGDENTRF